MARSGWRTTAALLLTAATLAGGKAVTGCAGTCPRPSAAATSSSGPRTGSGPMPTVGPLRAPSSSYACASPAPMVAMGLDPSRSPAARVAVFAAVNRATPELTTKNWDRRRAANAVAWGDVDGDGLDELVLGSSPHDNQRVQVRDDDQHGFGVLQELLQGWGAEFGVTALDTADVDGDGMAEIAVGRNRGRGIEVAILDDARAGFRTKAELDLGDSTVTDLAFGDADNDGRLELLVALKGGRNAGVAVIQDELGNYVQSTLAQWNDADRFATAVAVGDMDQDGVAEIAVGRSAGRRSRLGVYHFDGQARQYRPIAEWGDEWDPVHYPTSLAFADVDGDRMDELLVGRNGRCSPDAHCAGTAKLLVYDAPLVNGPNHARATAGEDWDPGRGVRSLAAGDLDGDGRREIVVGRDAGPGDPVLVYALTGNSLERRGGIPAVGDSAREARSVAVSRQEVCAVTPPPALPATWCEAVEQFPQRRAQVIRAQLETFLPQLRSGKSGVALFGPWNKQGGVDAARSILAGLGAIDLGLPEAPGLLEAGFPKLVNDYVTRNVTIYADIGTNGDFDMTMMPLIELIYRFGDARDPREPHDFLLTSAAMRKLLLVGVRFDRLDYPCGRGRWKDDDVYCSGNTSRLHRHAEGPGIWVPETENHLLMVNTWSYLVNQWITARKRGLEGIVRTDEELEPFQNQDSDLEKFLLAALGRVLKHGLWETNARAYQAYSVRAMQLLASYAASDKVKKAAYNALDYVATTYAFQSLHGKRLPPMRRNYDYRNRVGVYQNDYLAAQLGVLTGATVFDSGCQAAGCVYAEPQARGFALESALLGYRVSPILQDFMLRPDNHRRGFGAWARMQARYTEKHYLYGEEPGYPAFRGSPAEKARNQAIADAPLERTPEFYFVTQDYLNSAGGRHEHYDGLPKETHGLKPSLKDGLDFWAKPTILLGNLDVGHWETIDAAEQQTWLFRGGPGESAKSYNTGVYKNFAFGYAERCPATLVPAGMRRGPSGKIEPWQVTVIHPTSTGRVFAQPDYYVVLGEQPVLGKQNGYPWARCYGFWEIVPRGQYADEQKLLEHVVSTNHAVSTNDEPWQYTLATSGETLELNKYYAPGDPFGGITGDCKAPPCELHMLPAGQERKMPLVQVWQVNERYQFTNVVYAIAMGDGALTVDNPYLGGHLVIDSTNHLDPKRQEDFSPCH